ncbi:hypothetical protein F5B22DRAFT_629057, partial [Xylaria bambusicola]|uniref:uncharacterized protein n=1 Tax=Xylaria bambusicola TaxID=326684 RepID=UPI0020085B47
MLWLLSQLSVASGGRLHKASSTDPYLDVPCFSSHEQGILITTGQYFTDRGTPVTPCFVLADIPVRLRQATVKLSKPSVSYFPVRDISAEVGFAMGIEQQIYPYGKCNIIRSNLV